MRTAMMLTMVDVKNCVGLHSASHLLICLLNFDAVYLCKTRKHCAKKKSVEISRIELLQSLQKKQHALQQQK